MGLSNEAKARKRREREARYAMLKQKKVKVSPEWLPPGGLYGAPQPDVMHYPFTDVRHEDVTNARDNILFHESLFERSTDEAPQRGAVSGVKWAAGKLARTVLTMRRWLSDRTFDRAVMSMV